MGHLLTIHTVLKASPGAAIFGRDMSLDIPFLADWDKIGEHRHRQTNLNTECEITHAVIGIIKLMIKYFLEKLVFCANQTVSMKVILGLSHQFIQRGLSGFNAEQNQNELTSEESHPFTTIKREQLLMLLLVISPSSIKHFT